MTIAIINSNKKLSIVIHYLLLTFWVSSIKACFSISFGLKKKS